MNTGFILCTLSLIDVSSFLLNRGFSFVLCSRFNQDALENIFSQVHKRGGKTPSVLMCLRALRLISLGQFLSPVQRTNYLSDSDNFLIKYGRQKFENEYGQSYTSSKQMEDNSPKIVSLPDKFDTVTTNNFNNYDLNLLFYLSGSCMNAARKKKLCDNCFSLAKKL